MWLLAPKKKKCYCSTKSLKKNKAKFIQFITETSVSLVIPTLKPKSMSDESYTQLKQEVIDIIDKIEPVLFTAV